MQKQEQKVELTGRYLARTPTGEAATIDERTTFIRVQYRDGSWCEWQVEARRLFWGRIRVNPREDGDWDTAEPEPRRLTRQR